MGAHRVKLLQACWPLATAATVVGHFASSQQNCSRKRRKVCRLIRVFYSKTRAAEERRKALCNSLTHPCLLRRRRRLLLSRRPSPLLLRFLWPLLLPPPRRGRLVATAHAAAGWWRRRRLAWLCVLRRFPPPLLGLRTTVAHRRVHGSRTRRCGLNERPKPSKSSRNLEPVFSELGYRRF